MGSDRIRKARRPAIVPDEFDGTILLRAIPAGDDFLLICGQDFSSGRYLFVANPPANKVLSVLGSMSIATTWTMFFRFVASEKYACVREG